MGFFKKLRFWRRDVAAKPKGLQKQEEETAATQENSEDNFQCRITELEEEVRRLNIENKQLKAILGGRVSAFEEKVEERDSESVEIEATPALEKELKESRPDVTLRGQPTEMEGVGTDVAAIANTPQPSYPMCDRPNLARRWEQGKSDSNFNIEEDKAREEAAKLQRKYKELIEERYMKEVKKMKERYMKEEEKQNERYVKEVEKLRRQFEERYNKLKKEMEVICQRFRQMNKRRKKPIRDFEFNLKFRVPF